MKKSDWIDYMSQFQGTFEECYADIRKAERILDKVGARLYDAARTMKRDGSTKSYRDIQNGALSYMGSALKDLDDARREAAMLMDPESFWEHMHGED